MAQLIDWQRGGAPRGHFNRRDLNLMAGWLAAVITEGLKIPEDKLLPPEERTFMTWPEVNHGP